MVSANHRYNVTILNPRTGTPNDPPTSPDAPVRLGDVFAAEEGPLLRFAVGLTGRRAVAEDLVQEAFLKLHEHWAEVEHPKAWLYRCVRNLAINAARNGRHEQPEFTTAEPGDTTPLPDETLARFEACGMLRLAVAELPPPDRALVEMKYVQHLGYAEIARRTGLGVGNVGYRLHFILKHLGDVLKAAGLESSKG